MCFQNPARHFIRVDIQRWTVICCQGRLVSRTGPPEPGSLSGWTSRAWLRPAVGEGPSAEPSVAPYHKCTPRTSFSVPHIEEQGVCTQRCHLKQGRMSSVSRSVKSLAGHLASVSDKVICSANSSCCVPSRSSPRRRQWH